MTPIGSIQVMPGGSPAWGACSGCPTWHPEFDDEIKAREIVEKHMEVAHGETRHIDATAAELVDMVFVVRTALTTGQPAVHWLMETIGNMISNTRHRDDLCQKLGLVFTAQGAFCVPLAPRVDMGVTPELMQQWAQQWMEADEREQDL